jgi:hypothetical protein
MKKYLLLLVILSANYLTGLSQQQSQIRTATFLNNLNNFQQVFGDQNFPRANAGDVSADDNIYTCSSKLVAAKDSTGPFGAKSISSLALQGFEFNIPDDATIDNIAIRIRRFNNGRAPIGDSSLSLMQRYQCGAGGPCTYGVFWTFLDTYPGKIYSDNETEYVFSQLGSGNDGGFFHNEAYQWTPAIVNNTFFGVRIDNYAPIGKGVAQVCYDLVEVTVQYTQPGASALRIAPTLTDAKLLRQPIIYPNPFTNKTNIQFIAAETGKAGVELYNMTGAKIRTLFSGNVIQGLTYNVPAGDAQLPKGIYVYRISNGKEMRIGRIIKSQ